MPTPAPYDLTIDFGGDLFPVSGSRPRLSWKPAEGLPPHAAHELEIHVEDRPALTVPVDGHLHIDW